MSARKNGIGTPYRPPLRSGRRMVEVPGSTLKVDANRPKKPRAPLARKSSLKAKPPKDRPITPQVMDELTADLMLRDGRCVMCDHTMTPCDGPTDAHHIVAQRVLHAHYPPRHPVFIDKRNLVAVCRKHHADIEAGFLRLPPEALPDEFDFFLVDFGFEAWWDAEIARRVA